jgi:hypothetical protein
MSEWLDNYKDSRWQMMRLEVMKRDECKCRMCGRSGEDGVTLNVHHAFYEAGLKPWEYSKKTLVTLCRDCHNEIHETQKDIMVAAVNRSALSFSGARVMLYMFRNTLQHFGIMANEIMFMDDIEKRKKIAREMDEKLSAYAARLIRKTYGKRGGK